MLINKIDNVEINLENGHKYASKDNRIIVIHQENRGLVAARKAGLQHAVGDYIGFVDGDDYVEPTMYETLLQEIINIVHI